MSLTNLVSYVVVSEEPKSYGWVYDTEIANQTKLGSPPRFLSVFFRFLA